MKNSPGTNYFAPFDDFVNIALTSEDFAPTHLAVFADCNGNPNIVATSPDTFAVGCQMLRTDMMSGNTVYTMTGTTASPAWTLNGSGSGSETLAQVSAVSLTQPDSTYTIPTDISVVFDSSDPQPLVDQIKVTANGLGNIGLLNYGPGDQEIHFDVYWDGFSGQYIATAPTASLLIAQDSGISFQTADGQTAGMPVTPNFSTDRFNISSADGSVTISQLGGSGNGFVGVDNTGLLTFTGGAPATIAIGDPVLGGNSTSILFIDSSIDLAQDSNFQYDPVGELFLVGFSNDGSLGLVVAPSSGLYSLGDFSHTYNSSSLGINDASYLTDFYGLATSIPDIGANTPFPLGNPGYSGSGLNDMMWSGYWNNPSLLPITLTVNIDSLGTPDTFSWTDGTNSGSGIPISGNAQALEFGVSVTFADTTGHDLSDTWVWDYTVTKGGRLQEFDGANATWLTGDLDNDIKGQYYGFLNPTGDPTNWAFEVGENAGRALYLNPIDAPNAGNYLMGDIDHTNEGTYFSIDDRQPDRNFNFFTNYGGSFNTSLLKVSAGHSPFGTGVVLLGDWTNAVNSTYTRIEDENQQIESHAGIPTSVTGGNTVDAYDDIGPLKIPALGYILYGSFKSVTDSTTGGQGIMGVGGDLVDFPALGNDAIFSAHIDSLGGIVSQAMFDNAGDPTYEMQSKNSNTGNSMLAIFNSTSWGVTGATNVTEFLVDDANLAIIASVNGLFKVTDATGSRYLQVDMVGGPTIIGDIDGVYGGGNLAIDGNALTANSTGLVWDFGAQFLHNILDPLLPQDAATKAYADSLAIGLSWKNAVQAVTTTALPTNVYNNGASGVGATLTGTVAALPVIDGVTLSNGDRVLIKDETTMANNGIYIVTHAAAPYILTRSADDNTGPDMVSATTSSAPNGTVNGNTAFTQSTPGPITIGTDPIVWVNFLNTIYTAGTGLTLTGHVFSLNTGHANTWSALQTFPLADISIGGGTSGQVLSTNGSGVLSWISGTTIPTLTNHALVVGQGTTVPAFLSPGTSGNVVTSNGTDWISAAPAAPTSYTGLVEMWGGNDINTSIGNNTYTIILYAEYGMTINELKIIADSGTCSAAIKINGTNVTGISAVSVSNTIATGTATGTNTVSAGNKITLVLSSTSSLNNLQWTLKTTRT